MTEKTEYVMRSLNLKKDFDELIPFYDQIFEKELVAKGASVEAMLNEMKSLMPIFKFMSIFSKNFRHIFDGFVFEDKDGKIVSTVNIGFSGNYWEIAMVATHPDHRRKGLAKKLITKSIDHAKQNDAKMCILEVLEENEPAYKLYVKEGFYHYDTQVKLKLEKGLIKKTTKIVFPDEYTIEKRKHDKQTNQALYDLEVRATPEAVISFHPVNEFQYKKSFIIRLLRPLVKLFIRSKADRYIIKHNEVIIADLFVSVGRSEKDCHKMDVTIDPKHSEKLTEPLISFALDYLKNKSELNINTITMIRKSDSTILETMKKFGFTVFETDHLLGLKMDQKD
ncbi:MAG: GNAT family N-acetyltransferase [Candidatus Heimdallarchaeota archaeon]